MQEHAHEYGFINRFTKGFEYITGFRSEPWHYRYVGVDIATYMVEHNMSFEEYWAVFLDQ
jgi:D-alanyl-D-alanine carboxypeptidase